MLVFLLGYYVCWLFDPRIRNSEFALDQENIRLNWLWFIQFRVLQKKFRDF